jgi:hypothetical protein
MIARVHTIAGLTLALLVASAIPAHAGTGDIFKKKKKDEVQGKKLTPAQSALLDKAILREKTVIKVVKERAPIVETYIQLMRPDPVMRQVPESDEHLLGRVEIGKLIGDDPYKAGPKAGEKEGKFSFFKHAPGFLGGVTDSLHLQFREAGFVSMLLMDVNSFDKQHYNFYFVRNDFLGNTPTAVFDVTPASGTKEFGRFFGRIWVETRDGNVVRFNGDFAGQETDYKDFFHFDSWRTNVQPDLWLPTSVYVEESDPKSQTSTLRFKAINHVWGYVLKVPAKEAEQTSLEVVGAQDVSNDAQDESPLGAQRAFAKQAEDNVVERLFQAGLLDAPSDFDKTLEALANNILAYNNIAVSSPIHVRTLLTEPLESLAVGNTIILSKSLIDTTAVVTADGAQQMGNLNALLAFQLAHIISGHRLDTKYAFNDRLLFPDNSSFKRIPMHHTDADNQEAAKKAVELLNAKELADGQKYFGLYLQQLQQRVKALRALNEPQIGDGLVKGDNDTSFWMGALMTKGDKLDVKNLKQQAAEPLSAFLRFDPWTDQVVTLHTAYEPLLSPSDKMPFEVSPVYIKLSYYKPPIEAPAPPPAATTDPNAAPVDPNAAPAGTPGAAAPVDPNASPAAVPPPPPADQAPPAATPAPSQTPPSTPNPSPTGNGTI